MERESDVSCLMISVKKIGTVGGQPYPFSNILKEQGQLIWKVISNKRHLRAEDKRIEELLRVF